MFKSSLTTKLRGIFDIVRISYDDPGETREQDVIFVSIDNCKPRSGDDLRATVYGKITIYAQLEKLPFGFFQKKLYNASKDMQKDLFFYNFDNNQGYMGAGGLVERTCDFVYFYNESFDPDKGSITSVNFV